MATATITLSDCEDGTVDVHVTFSGRGCNLMDPTPAQAMAMERYRATLQEGDDEPEVCGHG